MKSHKNSREKFRGGGMRCCGIRVKGKLIDWRLIYKVKMQKVRVRGRRKPTWCDKCKFMKCLEVKG